MPLYFECTNFNEKGSLLEGWEEGSFKYCNFSNLIIDGGGLDGVLVGCVIETSDWYWSLHESSA